MLGNVQFGLLVDAVLRAGRVLGGMQFGVLGGCCFASLTAGSRGHAVWGAGGCCFASLTAGC